MSVGPIPWTAVNEYCFVNEIEGEEALDFHYMIRQMDIEYSKVLKDKADAKGG